MNAGPGRWLKTGLFYLVLLAGAVLFIFPFYWMVLASIKTPREVFDLNLIPSEITFQSYTYMLDRIPVGRSLFNSFLFAGGVTLITLVVTSMAGYALARLKFWGRDALFSVVLLTMMIPFQLLMIPLYVIVVKLGWMNSYAGLIFPVSVNALGIFIFRQFFRTVPQELIDAARIDGAGELQILFRVMLPLSRPAMITVAILTFMGPWNDLLWPLLVTRDQEMMPLAQAATLFGLEGQGGQWGSIMAVTTILALPVVLLYLFFQRYFIESISNTGMKG
ncbi:multiple sugar transport system permease protein [Planifilum fimeticola]|jgi:multiple sugar transport system permease protein|uniref:Multiple sugar transport system permease protein n=1 Tax=Planifilum fimeticola TaxID=201975 RepID=A0A2T0LII8_9BACL|nr:carbohydrate ABC transporter permease [Planifilum fimeticola]PRX42250.1 multiple sugar transport system permease protein [Planifilum fimeticola]